LSAEWGVLSAILSAAFMSSQRVTARMGFTSKGDISASLGVLITHIVAIIYFGLVTLILGDFNSIFYLTPITIISLGSAGIVHYVIGRTFSYQAYKTIGVNIASPFIAMSGFYSVIFGVVLLHEQISGLGAIGLILMLSGVMTVLLFRFKLEDLKKIDPKVRKKGLISAFLAGLFFGSSPLLVRIGLESGGSPITGPFISYIFAFILYVFIVLISGGIKEVKKINLGLSKYFILSGLLVNTAHFLRFIAISLAPISYISPLLSTNDIFSIFFTRILIKKYESFDKPVIIGIFLTALGVILITISGVI